MIIGQRGWRRKEILKLMLRFCIWKPPKVSGLQVWVGWAAINQVRIYKRRITFGNGKQDFLVGEALQRWNHLAPEIVSASVQLAFTEFWVFQQWFSLESPVQFGFHTLLRRPRTNWLRRWGLGNLNVQQELRTFVPGTRPAPRDERDGWLAMWKRLGPEGESQYREEERR